MKPWYDTIQLGVQIITICQLLPGEVLVAGCTNGRQEGETAQTTNHTDQVDKQAKQDGYPLKDDDDKAKQKDGSFTATWISWVGQAILSSCIMPDSIESQHPHAPGNQPGKGKHIDQPHQYVKDVEVSAILRLLPKVVDGVPNKTQEGECDNKDV